MESATRYPVNISPHTWNVKLIIPQKPLYQFSSSPIGVVSVSARAKIATSTVRISTNGNASGMHRSLKSESRSIKVLFFTCSPDI